ncbi:Autoinducer 2 sensor kinase/phosphatase LuxQ [Stieleria maiorica]|uniref:Autoinducer 2 sensor kinase/phosphatase LuxQ n=1 Tax=Stieleria maiorica TaxID=2795974 RepID=A0A5B9MCI5_9BACT|nr:PAS domain S-box protein [Stieleria maiorica]QEF98942.1 Autoinducer 2 sensor kinase/phosphatase LuxQ [Stieleria maiorica]
MNNNHDEIVDGPLIVGVGASAGGLEAFGELLQHLGDCGRLSLVFVQHREPSKPSLLGQLLETSTKMKVVEITERCKLKPGCVYVAPARMYLEIQNGAVRPIELGGEDSPLTSIDHFFHSLAGDQAGQAIGVVLSGAGSDGTVGLKSIRDAGGLTFAQDPPSAKYDSMPTSAATIGAADHVGRPSEIAAELRRYAEHVAELGKQDHLARLHEQIGAAIPLITKHLLKVTGHNFRHYKSSTLTRRIQRRIQLLKLADADEYLTRLQSSDDEAEALFRELLIGVTAFFRDPEAFDAISSTVLPEIFDGKPENETVRVWVAGCSTGEEAYSLAMLCLEHADRMDDPPEFQIFATDIDERALQVAREGKYATGIEDDVSPERLKRFFVKHRNGYQVTKQLRSRVLFSKHNLISDPPFSRQDLIACRNLLIYLGSHLQEKLIPLFHYAMRPSGFLFLGPSETISSHGELFNALDSQFRISQRKEAATGPVNALTMRKGQVRPVRGGETQPDHTVDLNGLRQRIILDEFAPQAVVIDQSGQVLNASDGVSKYLAVAGGDFHNHVVKMACPGLRIGMRAAINEATKFRRKVTHRNLSIRDGGLIQRVMLTVQPMPQLGENSELFLVVFQDVGEPIRREAQDRSGDAESKEDRDADAVISQMERELETTRGDLERTLQDMEAANEEMKSSNEELLSMNEELQSANEELESSKEQIRAGSDALARANADLENLLRSTQIATVFLDKQLKIRRFTPAIKEIYGLLASDVGRPLEQFVPSVDQMPPLPEPGTLDEVDVIEHTVRAKSGKHFIRRVLPYRSAAGVTDGVVVTFVDVSDLVQRESRLAALMSSTAEGIYGTDRDGICTFANTACARLLGYDSPDDLLGKDMHEVIHHKRRDGSRYPKDECKIVRAIREGKRMHIDDEVFWRADGTSFEAEYWSHPKIRDGEIIGCVVTFFDITERRRDERILAEAKMRLELSLEVADIAPWSWDMQTGQPVSNPTLNRLFGFDEDATPALLEFIQRVDESSRERVSLAIERAIKTGEVYDEEYPVRLPDGEMRHLRARGLVRAADGVAEDFFGVIADITERKRRELDLADREGHLRRVIDHQLSMVGVLKPDGTLVEANATALRAGGVEREDVIGKKFWECYWWNYDDEVADRLKREFERAVAGEIVRYDAVVRVGDHATATIDFMISPVRDADGQITHLIPSGVDVSDRKAAEKAVFQREQRLQLALDSGGMGLWEWDIQSDHITWSDQMYKMFAYTAEELEPSRAGFLRIVHPEDRQMLERMIGSAFSGNCETHEVEFRIIRGNDHATMWTLSRGRITRAADGTPLSMVSVAVDVTERKHWENELVDREAHLRRVINNQLGLVGVIDRNGILLEVDDRSLEIARTEREEVVGKHFADAPWWNYDPEVARQMRDAMRRALDGEVVRYDVSLFSHGSEGVMIDFMIAPVFDAEGRVEYLIPSGVDIRERVKIEQEQRSATRRMEMALRAGGMAAWEWSPTQSIWTRELYELLGIDPEREANSELFFSLVHPEDVDALKQSWQDAIDGVDTYDSEFRIVRPDGQIRWVAGVGETVCDESGRVVSMYGVNWDATQEHLQADAMRESERRAREANASKSEFLANMSHEIRTPMTAILGYADLLKELIDHEEAKQYLETIRRNGDYLLEIINDILDLSKIEAGKLDVQRESFDPHRLVEDVRSIMEVRAVEGGLTLEVDYDGNLPRLIRSDAKRLKQILINLVGNAIKFTPNGRVTIRVRFVAAERQLHIDVADTGIGIPDQQLRRLFHPFAQGDTSVTRNFGGTGLGLAISQRLAEMLGGDISVRSTEGVGSTFSVSVATGQVDASDWDQQDGSQSDAEGAASTQDESPIELSCRVLVVDDRREIRFLSKRILTGAGAVVDECEDGLLAVEHVSDCLGNGSCPDLVLLDMQMPKLDGYSTARKLRAIGYRAPIIALTADAMQGDMNKCLEAGCNDYLSKPIDAKKLLRLVSQMIRQSGASS